MKTFISWSGEISRQVAKALDNWLRDVFPDLEPWMSEHDIEAGSRWEADLTKELSESNFGILCLTPDNLRSPWLLFEAGALSKDLGVSRVVPYRFNLSAMDVGPPLSQFQGVDVNEAGTLKLIQSINNTKELRIESDRLERTFRKWWPDLDQELQQIEVTTPQMPVHGDNIKSSLASGIEINLHRLQEFVSKGYEVVDGRIRSAKEEVAYIDPLFKCRTIFYDSRDTQIIIESFEEKLRSRLRRLYEMFQRINDSANKLQAAFRPWRAEAYLRAVTDLFTKHKRLAEETVEALREGGE